MKIEQTNIYSRNNIETANIDKMGFFEKLLDMLCFYLDCFSDRFLSHTKAYKNRLNDCNNHAHIAACNMEADLRMHHLLQDADIVVTAVPQSYLAERGNIVVWIRDKDFFDGKSLEIETMYNYDFTDKDMSDYTRRKISDSIISIVEQLWNNYMKRNAANGQG